MTQYEINAARERAAVKNGEKKRYNTRRVIVTEAAWRNNHEGSAECFSTSMAAITAAYEESRCCDMW